jgi:hypothetical protein
LSNNIIPDDFFYGKTLVCGWKNPCSRFRVQGSRFRVQSSEFRVPG